MMAMLRTKDLDMKMLIESMQHLTGKSPLRHLRANTRVLEPKINLRQLSWTANSCTELEMDRDHILELRARSGTISLAQSIFGLRKFCLWAHHASHQPWLYRALSSLGKKVGELLSFQSLVSLSHGLIYYEPNFQAQAFEPELRLNPAQDKPRNLSAPDNSHNSGLSLG